jgi:hypothetical protein
MGMFDTLVFPAPVTCMGCGQPIASIQTKELGQSLSTYRVGDVVSSTPFATGVLTETLYCPKCHVQDRKIHVTIWHSLITGFHSELAQAEAALFRVDRADILNYLIGHQERETRHRRTLADLLSVLNDYAGYLGAPDKEEYLGGPLGGIWHARLKEFLGEKEPLTAMVASYRKDMGPQDEDDGRA